MPYRPNAIRLSREIRIILDDAGAPVRAVVSVADLDDIGAEVRTLPEDIDLIGLAACPPGWLAALLNVARGRRGLA